MALIADQRVRLCNGCTSSALPDRCISPAIFGPIFDRFHVASNKVLTARSNDISALCINKIVQPPLWICGLLAESKNRGAITEIIVANYLLFSNRILAGTVFFGINFLVHEMLITVNNIKLIISLIM